MMLVPWVQSKLRYLVVPSLESPSDREDLGWVRVRHFPQVVQGQFLPSMAVADLTLVLSEPLLGL